MEHSSTTAVVGVEVNSTVNNYLHEESMLIVAGTWDLCHAAAAAHAWLFVYPRDPRLVSRYLQLYSDTAVQLVVWLGPRADWGVYERVFKSSVMNSVDVPKECGLAPYEMLALARKDGLKT